MQQLINICAVAAMTAIIIIDIIVFIICVMRADVNDECKFTLIGIVIGATFGLSVCGLLGMYNEKLIPFEEKDTVEIEGQQESSFAGVFT